MCLSFRATTKEREALNVTSSTSDEIGQIKTKKTSLPSNYKEATSDDDMTTPAQESSMVNEVKFSEWN